jgi:beta-glucosidase
MNLSYLAFPKGFVWGAGTSAHQIEGAGNLDGKGESIWDRFSRTPGRVYNGQTGDIACDHYHRFPEDVALMKDLGLKSYRFSISWPRVLPCGTRPVNLPGLDFYDRLVDALLAANIEPFPTLYHWDLPQLLQDQGGWLNREVSEYFAEYAGVVVNRLGDRVRHWATLNEPWCIAVLGYLTGEHAPGLKDKQAAIQVGHNLLLGHGLATKAIRAATNQARKLSVGIVLIQGWTDPASQSASDRTIAENCWKRDCGHFMDPLFRGEYPASLAENMPCVQPGDLELISQELDFLGMNYYSRTVIGTNGNATSVPGSEYTDMGWEVHPASLRKLLERVSKEYKLPPIYITENGAAFKDTLSADGRVYDARRQAYINDHLEQVWLAIQDGVDVRGYFLWSLLDNFEWQHGYSKRFGIVHVDFTTQKRIIKESGSWYAGVIRQNALSKLPMVPSAG